MVEGDTQNNNLQITLYTCPGCEACNQAIAYVREWTGKHPGTSLDVVPILEQPEQAFRLQISSTPALIIEDELLCENVSLSVLAEKIQAYLDDLQTSLSTD